MRHGRRQRSWYARVALTSLILVAAVSTAMGLEGKLVFEQDGTPVANASVSVIGRGVSTRTDEEGRFTLAPDPSVPFELLVSLPGGRYMKPILVEEIPEDGVLVIAVSPLVTETVSVTGRVCSTFRKVRRPYQPFGVSPKRGR
jgi:hypothetical protein